MSVSWGFFHLNFLCFLQGFEFLWCHLRKTEHKSEGSAPTEDVGAFLELGRSILGEKGNVNLTCLFGFTLFLQCYFSGNCCNCRFQMGPHWNAAGICRVPRKWARKFWHSQSFRFLSFLAVRFHLKYENYSICNYYFFLTSARDLKH